MYLKSLTRLLIPVLLAGTLALNSLSAQRFAVTNPDFITWIPKVDTPPIIDGEVDQIWHAQSAMPIEFVQNGTVQNAADLSAHWFALYDDENYYFLIEVTDQWLESEASADNWRNDWIEVYYNMDNVKPGGSAHEGDNYQYGHGFADPTGPTVVPNGSKEGIEFVPLVTENGYRMEVKVPFATLIQSYPLTAEPGFSFGFDIAINDNDGLSTYDSVTYWWNSTGSAEWGNINGTGTIGLGDPFDGNYPPEVDPVDIQNAFEGQQLTFTVTASDANGGDTVTFSSPDKPSFVTVGQNGTVTVNALSGDAGTYEFTIVGSDGAKEGSTDVTLVVRDPNLVTESPVFGAVPAITVKQGNYKGVDIIVTDNDSELVTIEGTSLPEFATLIDHGDKTATLALNLDYAVAVQSYSITLLATDDYLNTDEITITVQVETGTALTEYYCDPVNGNIENDGSAGSPWGALEEVFAVGKTFDPGDRIYLLDGYHGEPVVGGNNAGYVYIMPAAGAEPRLSKLNLNTSAHYWHISGLNISRSYKTPYSSQGMVGISGTHNVLSNCLVFSQEDTTGWTASQWISWAPDGISVGGTYCIVEDCTVLNTNMAIYQSGDNAIIRRNHIQYFRGDGIRALGNDSLYEYNYIADCINVDGNHDDGIQSFAGSLGSAVGTIHNVILRGNVIVEVTDPSRTWHRGPLQGIGCFDGMFNNWTVENNVVAVTQAHGIAFYGIQNSRIINNTVVESNGVDSQTWIGVFQHKQYASAPAEQKPFLESNNNLIRNNIATRFSLVSTTGTVDNNHDIEVADFASYFVSFPYDLRLREGSPAIDAGTNNGASATDADGKLRPIDGDDNGSVITDMGAYEFGTATWRGLQTDGNGDAWSAEVFGRINTSTDPWIFVYDLSRFIYIPMEWADLSTDTSGWIWVPSYE